MAIVSFENIGIRSLSACVPQKRVITQEQTEFFSEKQLKNFADTTGVIERRFAEENICASDLCYEAAISLIEENDIDKGDIDALIFISQTPDYRIPGSSIILQDRLGLSTGTIAFDVNMTCSGYLYGLFLSYSLLNNPGLKNVLLLVGETLSKITSRKDKSTGLLLGDGGCATLITKNTDYGKSYFSLNTDGKYFDAVMVPGGGFRKMSSPSTLQMNTYEDGSMRNEEQIAMQGMDVFGFAVSHLPRDVKAILEYSGETVDQIDKFIFHQANKFMMDMIAKKLKLDPSKVLYSIQKYGNTSGVSIPLTMVDKKNSIAHNEKILLNGVGAGFSWGSIILNLSNCNILDLKEI